MTAFPCVRCGKFNTVLGVARCEKCQADVDRINEMKRYGHTAHRCPHRIDVSTYLRTAYIHGPCEKEPKVATQDSEFKFVVGNTEYTVTGFVTEIGSDYGFASQEVHLRIRGEVTVRTVHDEPHFNPGSRHQGKLCVCNCNDCYVTGPKKCKCKECSCGQ